MLRPRSGSVMPVVWNSVAVKAIAAMFQTVSLNSWIVPPPCPRMVRLHPHPRAASMHQPFDRAAEDLGNAIHLEHVNVQVPDQRLATLFYVTGLGLTRDPYLMVSDTNMWINVGRSQFHLPSGEPQVVRGHTGIVISGRQALLDRLPAGAP